MGKECDDYEKVLQEITEFFSSVDDKMWWVKSCRRVLKKYGKLKYPRLTFRQQVIDKKKK